MVHVSILPIPSHMLLLLFSEYPNPGCPRQCRIHAERCSEIVTPRAAATTTAVTGLLYAQQPSPPPSAGSSQPGPTPFNSPSATLQSIPSLAKNFSTTLLSYTRLNTAALRIPACPSLLLTLAFVHLVPKPPPPFPPSLSFLYPCAPYEIYPPTTRLRSNQMNPLFLFSLHPK